MHKINKMKIITTLSHLAAILLLASCVATKQTIIFSEQLSSASSGDPVAQLKVGYAYDMGIGVEKNINKAVIWYKKSAAQGNADAQNNLGSMFLNGQGVKQDYKTAIMWLEKAANQNHSVAQNTLAIRYILGQGVEKDKNKAVYWYEESAKNGNISALRNLGNIYALGREVDQNNIVAYKWLDLARFYTQGSKNMNLKWGIRGDFDNLIKKMTESEIEEGKNLSSEWDNKYRLTK